MRLWTEEEDVNRLPPDEKRNGEWQKARVLKRRRITDREAVLISTSPSPGKEKTKRTAYRVASPRVLCHLRGYFVPSHCYGYLRDGLRYGRKDCRRFDCQAKKGV
ncbi:hypothetical protein HPP92_016791 [Vanilla planifolia]|uniref:Uncharacterized protein n=1 Tax=Vanilla planifolia TaxID=51239 RepID=A0A835QKU0_VANPL|nr:hypothetical protein HPP92_016791 [Vanilla planifolia]